MKQIKLKAKEFKLFQCLFENRNTIVTKEKLFDLVWGDAYFSDGTLNVHIRKLREKLEEDNVIGDESSGFCLWNC